MFTFEFILKNRIQIKNQYNIYLIYTYIIFFFYTNTSIFLFSVLFYSTYYLFLLFIYK